MERPGRVVVLAAVYTLATRNGSEAERRSWLNVLPIWQKRMAASCRAPTPNSNVIYAMSYLVVKQDGPIVEGSGILGRVCRPLGAKAL